jgi:DNA transformation protein
MAVSKQYLEYLLEQLKGLGGVEARRMFGGLGLYSRGTFFGLLYKDRLYFKTDESTRPEYEARGSEGFRPRPGVNVQMTYYTVPAEVLEDEDELVQWAQKAVTAALAKEASKRTADQAGTRTAGAKSGSMRAKKAPKRTTAKVSRKRR